VTLYQIEVRAISEQYDVQAHQVAREILQLPGKHLPSLAAISASTSPLTIRTAQLYYLTGQLTSTQLDQLTRQLLIDPVVQEATVSQAAPISNTYHIVDAAGEAPPYHSKGGGGADAGRGPLRSPSGSGIIGSIGHRRIEDAGRGPLRSPSGSTSDIIVDIFFHPGVTDTLAESVLTGASMLGITTLEHVETGRRYLLDKRLSEDEVHVITGALLYNPVIQNYVLHNPIIQNDVFHETVGADLSRPSPIYRPSEGFPISNLNVNTYSHVPTYVPLSGMTGQQLLELSKTGLLALNLDEMRAIQQHYQEQRREPTDVELETLAQTWSEHCSHKTFKATIHYQELDGNGKLLEQETINGLLKQYIMRATQQINHPWVVSAFSDNAGIMRFTESQDIAFKVETHNHPSAIEPFGGANTGVGGVIRDVLGVSAQPVACTDILCFGPAGTSTEELPAGILSPHRIASGVVNGVRDYGNKMGIPTVNGAILYHEGFIYNPLVFCGCLGILPRGSHPRRVQPGDKIVVLGGRTGRDGIHGATFSSGEMSSEINAQAGSAVQIGAPITEKKVADVIIQARDRQLYTAITDCGAGGFSSAIGEMGAGTGARVELEKAPLKYQGLAPWEIWLSEAQERMVLAVPPGKLDELLEICAIEEVEASIIGTFTADHRLTVSYHGQIVAGMDMAFLHEGRPARTMDAVWIQNDTISNVSASHIVPARSAGTMCDALLSLLRHPTIASKESVVRRYDHEVQGATVLKPLVGRAGNGPGDAVVLQPILDVGAQFFAPVAGIIISNGINPLYGKIDPYHMAINAVDEALRNLAAVGGDIERAAILDNFCWGNPGDPVQLGLLVRAVKGCYDAAIGYGTPFISGKDSLNNEYRSDGERLPVMPTLLISAIGVIDDAAQTIDMSLKQPGNLLYQIGITRNELAGSHYAEVIGMTGPFPGTTVPHVELETARTTMKTLGSAIREGLVQACHDLSEGGLAVAAAEMSLAGLLGMSIDVGMIPQGEMEQGDRKEVVRSQARATPASRATTRVAPTMPRSGGEIVHSRGDPLWSPGRWSGASPSPISHTNALNAILLFSESASRFLVEVSPEHQDAFEAYMRASGVQDFACIGVVNDTERFVVQNGDQVLIDLSVGELQDAWKGEQA
jgi:phosphoribosylformylglycinamidine synthase subunit PurSL